MDYLKKLFEGLVDESVLNDICNNYTDYSDTTLSALGVDSLNVMEIVIRIETIFNVEIDYDDFEIEQIETPRKILKFIEEKEK